MKIQLTIGIGFILILTGCASTRPLLELKENKPAAGVYYVVKRGDTIWRISKLYDLDVKDIIRANRLPDATKINVGQKLFIPSAREKIDYSKTTSPTSFSGTFTWPVAGKVISYFGSKKGRVSNKGIDIEAREGSKVVADDIGIVGFIDENMKGLGKTIIIDHENGFSTVYAHNSEILVKVGQKVKRNQPIARVGKTGRATKPYLHFQIRKGYEPQNPFYYLP
jgi:murein DD-endopeptidase MepM/ murein hydrolase activator NlpD